MGEGISTKDAVLDVAFHCPHCLTVCDSKINLRSHVKKEHPNEAKSRKFRCRFCLEEFQLATSRDSHEAIHADEKPFLCEFCGKEFQHSSNLRIHLRTHSANRKKFPCQLCNKTFLTRIFLKDHINKHTGTTPYQCTKCGKAFHGRIHLRQHRWVHKDRSFSCAYCGQIFNRKGNMSAHAKECQLKKTGGETQTMHTDRNVEKDAIAVLNNEQDDKIELSCRRCKKQFDSQADLQVHKGTHIDVSECKLCGKVFQHHGSLTYHRRVAHTGDRPFKCSSCSKDFLLQSQLTIHERREHTGERPFECPHCSSAFVSKGMLRSHILSHSNNTNFTCEVCGKGYRRKEALSVHLKKHSTASRHSCDACEKAFLQKSDLVKHKVRHHPDQLAFFCKFCGDSFARKSQLSKHAACRMQALLNTQPPEDAQRILNLATQ